MAASIVPTDYLAGYAYLASSATAPANGIFFPLTLLTSLNASEANASTGDIRKIVAALLDAIDAGYKAQTEKPTKMTVSSSPTSSMQGNSLTVQTRYAITITRDGTIGDVSAE